jgi:general stress protein YciG
VAKEDRGFASMDPAKQREIASKGGKAAHQKGTAHEWTSEEARDAGRKGGIASHQRRRERLTPDTGEEQMSGREQMGGYYAGTSGMSPDRSISPDRGMSDRGMSDRGLSPDREPLPE